MNQELITKSVQMSHSVGHVLLATANQQGVPHIAAARGLATGKPGQVLVSEWFCPNTVANLKENDKVAVVIWDVESDVGYQLVGRVEKAEDELVVNGKPRAHQQGSQAPQAAKRLLIKVEKTLDFRYEPHSDTEE